MISKMRVFGDDGLDAQRFSEDGDHGHRYRRAQMTMANINMLSNKNLS